MKDDRVPVLENEIAHIKEDMSEIKKDVREIKTDIVTLSNQLVTEKLISPILSIVLYIIKNLLPIILAVFVGIAVAPWAISIDSDRLNNMRLVKLVEETTSAPPAPEEIQVVMVQQVIANKDTIVAQTDDEENVKFMVFTADTPESSITQADDEENSKITVFAVDTLESKQYGVAVATGAFPLPEVEKGHQLRVLKLSSDEISPALTLIGIESQQPLELAQGYKSLTKQGDKSLIWYPALLLSGDGL
jgi:hypothetical protein